MTKEAKLDRARRLLPEWSVYDEEARLLYEQWHKSKAAPKSTPEHDEL
jgi:hypothetical protein